MAKKQSASSLREKRVLANELFTKPLDNRSLADLRKLAKLRDSKIDFSDAPQLRHPHKVFVGRFYRPIRQHISLRVDHDVLAWFRSSGKKYQTYINEVLRREMTGKAR